jgi:multiple sugar transport system substrate-binding protein
MSNQERGGISMVLRFSIVGLCAVLAAGPAHAETTTLSVAYAFPGIMKAAVEEIARRFTAEHPDIAIEFPLPAADYEELTQKALIAAATGGGADIGLHGYHRVRLLADRNAAIPVDKFIAAENGWVARGYTHAAQVLCDASGKSFGLPFTTATQIVYYNVDVLRRAGGDPDHLPETWPQIIGLAKRIEALKSGATSLFFDYKGAGNWGFLGLVESAGGRMMTEDERDVTLDGPAGRGALELLRTFGEAGQVDMSRAQAQQAFSAGGLGILVYTSSALTAVEKQVAGRFEIRTGTFPITDPRGKIPAGGTCAMIFTKDAAKQRAAWEFIKFAAGPVGQTIMATGTGYMPNNTIAIERTDLLGDFYAQHPNYATSVRQLSVMTGFWTWPGPNSIKIQDVVENHLVEVATLKTAPDAAMAGIVRDIHELLAK